MSPRHKLDTFRLDPEGLYGRLGVTPSAGRDEIVAAFRQKARILHPDVPGTGDTDAFVAARQAYDTLTHPHRRAAYDRSARQAALAGVQVGEIKPVTPAAMPVPWFRHPRLSDLPIGLWVGAALVICLGLVEVARHLFQHSSHQQSVANAPIAAGVSPTAPGVHPDSANQQPPPVHLAGMPNYYTVPAAGPTILWRREADRTDLVAVRQLPAFSTVQALRMVQDHGLIEVQATEDKTGLVEATRLAPGNAIAARRAFCAYYSGPLPANGEILERRAAGSGSLDVSNRTSQPMVMKLRDTLGEIAVSVFLAPGAQATVIGVPKAPYQPDFATGELWSRACNSFAAGMRAQRFTTLLPLATLNRLTLPPDEGELQEISDEQFEAR